MPFVEVVDSQEVKVEMIGAKLFLWRQSHVDCNASRIRSLFHSYSSTSTTSSQRHAKLSSPHLQHPSALSKNAIGSPPSPYWATVPHRSTSPPPHDAIHPSPPNPHNPTLHNIRPRHPLRRPHNPHPPRPPPPHPNRRPQTLHPAHLAHASRRCLDRLRRCGALRHERCYYS